MAVMPPFFDAHHTSIFLKSHNIPQYLKPLVIQGVRCELSLVI
jgi:hypothetical protein